MPAVRELTQVHVAVPSEVTTALRANRVISVDHFRGFAVMAMAVMNHLLGVETLPRWLQHTPDIGLTMTDLGAPLFVFAIGLTYRRSFEHRVAADGLARTIVHFIRRAALLFVIGFVMAFAQLRLTTKDSVTVWSTLQAIGAAVFMALPLIALPFRWRLVAGIGLLAGYQFLLDRYWLPIVLGSIHGGPPGALSWAAMLILASLFADAARPPASVAGASGPGTLWRRPRYVTATVLALAAGLGLSLIVPIGKARVSASYVLIGLAFSAAMYALFELLTGRFGWRSAVLTAWGKNPLVLYILLNVLLALLVLPAAPEWHTHATAWLLAAQALVLIATLSQVARWLARRGIVISL